MRPLSGGRVRMVIQPTPATAQSCYLAAYTSLCLSASPAQKSFWASCMSLLHRDTTDTARDDFIKKLPGCS